MKKSTIYQIYRFQLQSRTKRIVIALEKIKTTIMIQEKIVAAIETAAMVGQRIAAIV